MDGNDKRDSECVTIKPGRDPLASFAISIYTKAIG